jgi:LPS sulfotransferase NodH
MWFSQRVGSTMLAQALEDTGIAGRPREWLNAASASQVLEKLGVASGLELRDFLWSEATTANGVLGIKFGFTRKLYDDLLVLFGGIDPSRTTDALDAWNSILPNCKHLFLTRRNKIRLAVSWWRAIKSEEWHRPNRSEPTCCGTVTTKPVPADLADMYDYAAIEHLFVEANLREAEMQECFDRLGVVPYTVVYEDLIADYEPTVLGVLDFLEIPGHREIAIPSPAFHRLADEVSEKWFQRFLRERWEKLK